MIAWAMLVLKIQLVTDPPQHSLGYSLARNSTTETNLVAQEARWQVREYNPRRGRVGVRGADVGPNPLAAAHGHGFRK